VNSVGHVSAGLYLFMRRKFRNVHKIVVVLTCNYCGICMYVCMCLGMYERDIIIVNVV
jgi:hypothetical protein